MGVQIVAESCQDSQDVETCNSPASPFASILNTLMLNGGFSEVAAVILYTSALAAIMSTTDSILISISQIITQDMVYPMKPSSTPNQIAWAGRFVSLIVTALSIVVGLTFKNGITYLMQVGFPIAIQMTPAFYIGLFSPYRPHPWCLAFPAMLMIIGAIFIQIFYASTNMHPAILSVLINFGLVFVCELARLFWIGKLKMGMFLDRKALSDVFTDEDHSERPKWDKPAVLVSVSNLRSFVCCVDFYFSLIVSSFCSTQRFGEHSLSPALLSKMMHGFVEPIKDLKYCLLMCIMITVTTPLLPELQPPIVDGVWELLPSTVRGLPWWAFKAIFLLLVLSLIPLHMINSIPDEYPFDEEEILRSGIDADAIELEPDEKGGRNAYDEPNEKAAERREMIRRESARIIEVNKEAKARADSIRKKETGARENLKDLIKNPSARFQNDLEKVPEKDDEFVENETSRVEEGDLSA